LPPRLENVPMEVFARGLAWLKRDARVDGARLAVMGGSKGAEPALLLAAREPKLRAVVATQPSSVGWPGITFEPEPKPGWSENGKPLVFLHYAKDTETEKGSFFHYKNALAGLAARPGAVIEVEKIRAPILLVCGEADTLWPSCPMADQIAARLQAKGRPA